MSLRTRPCAKCGARFYAPVDSKADTCQTCDGSRDRAKQKAADAKIVAASNAGRNTTIPQSVNPRSKEGEAELAAVQQPPKATRVRRTKAQIAADAIPMTPPTPETPGSVGDVLSA
jgi:DnaJ-class molecular chaperone